MAKLSKICCIKLFLFRQQFGRVNGLHFFRKLSQNVFLYPSPTEGFGLVFAEAMYCGSVLVTYDNEVTREVAGGFAILETNSIEGLERGVNRALDINM